MTITTPPLTFGDLMWVTGLLEGEGSFITSTRDYPLIKLKMTDCDVVERFANLMGGYAVSLEPRGLHKDQFVCSITGPSGRNIMTQIYPFMSNRRQGQIATVFHKYVTRPDWPVCTTNMVKKKAAHVQWHVNREVVMPNCPFCREG